MTAKPVPPTDAPPRHDTDRVAVRVEWVVVGLLAILVATLGVARAVQDPKQTPFDLNRSTAEPGRTAPTYHLVVDVNQASWQRLTLVPGIGDGRAKAIVEYRDANGPFTDLDQLDDVYGIGPSSIERWRPYLSIGSVSDNR